MSEVEGNEPDHVDNDVPSSDSEDWEPPKDGETQYREEGVKDFDPEALEGEEKELAGEVVLVVFQLPDGELLRRKYVMGHTIALLKANLEDIKHYPYDRIVLTLNGKTLIDPLSLNDLPFKANEENIVVVAIADE